MSFPTSPARTLLACLAAAAVTATPTPEAAASEPSTQERIAEELLERVNDERAARDLPLLRWDDEFGRLAADWSAQMADGGQLAHRNLSEVAADPAFQQWGRLGENVALGVGDTATAGGIHGMLMRSPPHRANLLDPAFEAAGIGVVCDAGGRLWATQMFGRLRSSGPPARRSTPPQDPFVRDEPDGSGCRRDDSGGGPGDAGDDDGDEHGQDGDRGRDPEAKPDDDAGTDRGAEDDEAGADEETSPGARSTAPACPPGKVPTAGFADTVGGTHEEAVDCLAWWGITAGRADGGYGPAEPISRGQLATFLVALADLTVSLDLDEAGAGRFGDLGDSPHADAATRLAAAGIVRGVAPDRFEPHAPVRRDQMASFLAGFADATDPALLSGPGDVAFGDVADSVHRDSIARVAAAGLTTGRDAESYVPRSPVTRGQMAAFVVRLAAALVEHGHAELPH